MTHLLGIPVEKAVAEVFADKGGYKYIIASFKPEHEGHCFKTDDDDAILIKASGEMSRYRLGLSYPSHPFGHLTHCITYPNPMDREPPESVRAVNLHWYQEDGAYLFPEVFYRKDNYWASTAGPNEMRMERLEELDDGTLKGWTPVMGGE